jgi:hypothetical protein
MSRKNFNIDEPPRRYFTVFFSVVDPVDLFIWLSWIRIGNADSDPGARK